MKNNFRNYFDVIVFLGKLNIEVKSYFLEDAYS